jgi:23S rRNA (guanosine2251-2'-O)-methyltransferase
MGAADRRDRPWRRTRTARPAAAGEVHGIGPVLEVLRAGRRRLRRLWLAGGRRHDERMAEIVRRAGRMGVAVEELPAAELGRRAPGAVHQGVVAEVEPLQQPSLEELLERLRQPALLVALDQVQDPHNLGAVIRSAEAAGADAVLVTRERMAPLGAAALKVAEGAAEHLPVVAVPNLARALDQARRAGLWLVGLDAAAGRAWSDTDLVRPTVLVLGSEGRGLRRLVRESCDDLVSVPMLGRVGSLNVSAAAAVVLFECVRQRRASPVGQVWLEQVLATHPG